MPLRWENIKSFNNSQNNAFEELVCQLAREENIDEKREFYRVAAPDGGVEAYCILKNGVEYGWQAKYFSSMGTSQWSQLTKSFKTALKKHPKLTKYFVCIPLDRQDPRQPNQKWFMDRWNEKVQEWTDYTQIQDRKVSFEYWGNSELVHRLSQEKHAGRKLFWFSQEDFSDNWFEHHVETSIKNLGKRYTPELNVELKIAKNFDSISRNDTFRRNIREKFHEFILKINKALDSLLTFKIKDEIKQARTALENIIYQFSLSQKKELFRINIELLENNRIIIKRILSECSDRVHDSKEKNDTHGYIQHSENEALEAIYDFSRFIESPLLKLVNCPTALLSGPAGIGKSHLLADIALNRIKSGKSCILFLGQHFTSKESPWTQILRNLLRFDCNEKQFLGALNAKAEAQGERLLFLVDAINEGRGRYFWPDHLSGFIHEFSNYPWLGLVLSIRSSYEELITPGDFIAANKLIKISHSGFDSIEYQASSFFFAQYGIEQPSIPLLNPEFSNPLFLKLFCEGLHRSGLTKIPKGYGGISSIIDFFIESIDAKLAEPSFFDYPSNRKVIKKVINDLVAYKLDNNLNFVPYEEAFDIADKILSRFSSKRRFLDALISEGIFSKNLFWKEKGEYEEGVYLAYERFEDHLTTSYLLDKYSESEDINNAFKAEGKLYNYIERSPYNRGILESLSIQVPEKIGKELYELLDEERRADISIIESFVYSLIWRKTGSIQEKTREYVNEYVLRYEQTFDSFFQMVYSVSSDPFHFYNADRLHSYLMQFSLADRDEAWTTYLHDQDYQGTAMSRLIDWARSKEDKSYLYHDSRLLAAKALAWLFTSTNISFRDLATKALVVLLENNIPIITKLLSAFKTVNDPYVVERIFAAAYGSVLRSEQLEGIEELSHYIVEMLFKAEEVYPNVLVRDYARNIIEYAEYKGCVSLDDITIIRPPYRSSFPSSFPTNEEIDAYEIDYKSETFKDYLWGQNSILSSMVTEYGREMCSYGDFGRYTFQSAFRDWKDFDPNDLSNYACSLIFDKYGYDVEKHGKFDRNATRGDRYRNTKERIGKKYQWIAFYEVLARVTDNHKMVDESTGWGNNQQYIWYQGPWEPFVRNIDPTVVHSMSEVTDKSNLLVRRSDYHDWQGTHDNWLNSDLNLPKPDDIISVNDEWLILEDHLSWDEPVPIGQDKYDHPRKHLWYQIRSYLVQNDEAEKLINWLRDQHFMGRWFPEGHSRYQVFSREYYWSPAYRFFDNPYYGGNGWEKVYDRKKKDSIIAKVLPTSEEHNWESGSDYRNQPTYLAPREYMFHGMKLQYSKNIGEWLDEKGQVVCCDPSVRNEDSSVLIVNKKSLQDFLKENKLRIFWTCLGEKNILGASFRGERFSQWLELSGVYTLDDGHVEGEMRPVITGS